MMKIGLFFICCSVVGGGIIFKLLCGIPLGNVAEILQVFIGLMGVIGVIYTLNLQREALKSQEEEFKRQARLQRKEDVKNRFFKMIDYHNEIVSQFLVVDDNEKEYRGRAAFVSFQIKLASVYGEMEKLYIRFVKKLYDETERIIFSKNDETLKEIMREHSDHKAKLFLINKKLGLPVNIEREAMAISYLILHYGFNKGNKESLLEELKYVFNGIDHGKVSEVNGEESIRKFILIAYQEIHKDNPLVGYGSYLSAYFKNMYNAIKLVDTDDVLTDKEKYDLVSLLRAQLSYPEIYVLFFSLFAKFGKKWIENNFVVRYAFVKNISKVDLDLIGINPRDYFPDIDYENYPPEFDIKEE